MIKFVRNLAAKWYVGGTLAASILMYSCQAPSDVRKAGFTGEELFNGIFFGDGEVSARIPEIASQLDVREILTADETAALNSIRASLTADLKNADPNFFVNFKSAIQSGDHLIIEKALTNASQSLYDAVLSGSLNKTGLTHQELSSKVDELINVEDLKDASGKVDEKAFKDQIGKIRMFGGAEETQKEACLAVAVAAVLVLAVAAAAAAIVFIFWVGAKYSPDDGSELQEEMIVNSIASNLSIE
ncbi:MAG TPA: hypothetical protein VD927_00570 [Chryseosolibacter sp.]|nr:hypothetical protein [Chryseosolibacter sp.]